ncbi:MAG: ComF family protein [Lachnospiraceae bacterium]|nr:ComF family protein [Lachnospiraceae bacterium]
MKDLKGSLLDIIYPRRCAVCDLVLPFGQKYICKACKLKLIRVKEPRCVKCGRPLTKIGEEYCKACTKARHEFTCGLSLFMYNDAMRESIFRFKYGGRQEYAEFYAFAIAKYLKREICGFNADAIIPVPLHESRLKERGYNQSELISERLGKLLDIPVQSHLVSRIKNTKPQKKLNSIERRKNLKKAFKYERNVVQLKSVIVFDDIYTTGSTIDSLSLVLKEAGVKNVFFITLSTGTPI